MSDEWRPRLVGPPRVVWPVPVDPAGLVGPTRGQAAGPRWRRSSSNLHVPSRVDGAVPEQRIVEAFARSPDEGVVTGWASLRLHRAAYFDGRGPDGITRLPVIVMVGSARLRNTVDMIAVRALPPPCDVVVRHGIRCTLPDRALLDHIAQVADLREAVVAVDMTAAAELTSVRRFGDFLDRNGGARGIRLARSALALADERSRSPQEPRFRLVWQLDAGWPRPLVNRDVFDLEGGFIGCPDLLDPVRRPAGPRARGRPDGGRGGARGHPSPPLAAGPGTRCTGRRPRPSGRDGRPRRAAARVTPEAGRRRRSACHRCHSVPRISTPRGISPFPPALCSSFQS